MKLVLFIVVLILQTTYLDGEENKISPSIILEHNIFKGRWAEEKEGIFKVEVPTKLFYKDLEFNVHPIWEYNLSKEDVESRLRKVYISYLLKDVIYFSLGKQPIIWGVGRGKNPINFFKELRLLEKQKEPGILEEGINSTVLSIAHKGMTVESILSFSEFLKKTEGFGLRLKGLLYNLDVSIAGFKGLRNEKDTRFGFDFEGDVKGLFNLYSEVAFKGGIKDYCGLIGLSRMLSSLYKTTLDLEYLKAKEGEEHVLLQLSFTPKEEFSGLFIGVYDIKERYIFLMPIVALYPIKHTELRLVPVFCLNGYRRPFEYSITAGVTHWLRW